MGLRQSRGELTPLTLEPVAVDRAIEHHRHHYARHAQASDQRGRLAMAVRVRAMICVASTMADAEQAEVLRHRAALGQLIDRVAAGRAGDDDIIRLRDLFGPIALLPTGERGTCRLVEVGRPGST